MTGVQRLLHGQGDTVTDKKQDAVATVQGNPAELIRIAVESGAEVEKLEKLMELQERWDAREAQRAYVAAMAKFQQGCPVIPESKEVRKRNGELLYVFAPLKDIIACIGNWIHECGFMYGWDTAPLDSGGAKVTCIVTHVGGHREQSSVLIPATQGQNTNASQDHGIVITYGKRYSFKDAFGITSGMEDTDGGKPPEVEVVTQEQHSNLVDWATNTKTDHKDLCEWAGCDDLESFPAKYYNGAIEIMQKKEARIKKSESGELPL